MHNNYLIYTHTSSKTSSSPSAPVKRPFIHAANTPHSHFPTHSFCPLSHRPLASSAARINAQFPFGNVVPIPCYHADDASLSPWHRDWQMLSWMPRFSQWQIRARLSCAGPAVASWAWCWEEKGLNTTATGAHTHSNGSFGNTKCKGVPARAVSADVMFHLCGHCVASSLNMLTEAFFQLWQIPIHSLAFNDSY